LQVFRFELPSILNLTEEGFTWALAWHPSWQMAFCPSQSCNLYLWGLSLGLTC